LSQKLAAVGIVLLVLYYGGEWLKAAGYGTSFFPASKPELILLRLGSVSLVVTLIVLLSVRVRTLPPTLLSLGQRTLLIYLTHLVFLYGSPWNTGLNRFCDKCLPVWPALSAALLMLTVMIAVAVLFSKIEFSRLWTISTLHKLNR
jgi:fucose 4-O-acetylase-like acetyltransferase